MEFGPEALPYNPISQFYKSKFGQKVFKVPVAISDDCPNRRGLKGMEVCIFCDEHGSFAYPESQKQNLEKQIRLHQQKVSKRFNSDKFVVYFQAYTTTFNQLKQIREAFEVALSFPDMVGIVVGTRPDCLSPALFDLWNEYADKTFLSVEIGVQSFDNKQLDWMKRGHTAEQSIKAIHRIKEKCPKVYLGVHLMFGWPDETEQDMINSAHICNQLPLNDVKLHNLHVLKNTPLADLFFQGEFTPIELEDYAHLVGVFLSYLSPNFYVHRLVALASRWDELIAPEWTRYKMTNYQKMIDSLRQNQLYQGKYYQTNVEVSLNGY